VQKLEEQANDTVRRQADKFRAKAVYKTVNLELFKKPISLKRKNMRRRWEMF
jgi:hypothetical protein